MIRPPRLGLLVNPAAGIGGPLAQKGSDGLYRGATFLPGTLSHAEERAAVALRALELACPDVDVFAYPREMGEYAVVAAGFVPHVIGRLPRGPSTAQDTRNAVFELRRADVDLIMFAGGDGTAVDVLHAESPVALGIPAGVKMQSAVFGITPQLAGAAAAAFLMSRQRSVVENEVVDLDEAAARAGVIAPRLRGTMRTPADRSRIQAAKARTAPADADFHAVHAAAWTVVKRMRPGVLYLLGPGTSTRAVSQALGLPGTLLGVDVVSDRRVVALDVTARELDALIEGRDPRLVLSPVGGQGFLVGRGNQQLSLDCLRRIGLEGIIVLATEAKLAALAGRPLLVDTGDQVVDELLSGYARVVTGANAFAAYRVGPEPPAPGRPLR